MERRMSKTALIVIMAACFLFTFLDVASYGRAGSGKSFGSRGSRSYSSPSRPSPSPGPAPSQRQEAPPYSQPSPSQQPGGGGFLRSLGGGILGGLLGGFLFRSLGFGGYGAGGSGIGIFELLLILAGGYFIYRMVRRRKKAVDSVSQDYVRQGDFEGERFETYKGRGQISYERGSDIDQGLSYIHQMDQSFDKDRFKDNAMDIFFRVQGAWTHRDIGPVSDILTDEARGFLQGEIDMLRREKKVNRLENIAVRNAEITEAWQESGRDFVTVRFFANLLDYTSDEKTGEVLSGSVTEPVKFEEYWTFTRALGNNPWKLSAINQA
jgi:predicted lipid-binding transport protein (Tim44 family)